MRSKSRTSIVSAPSLHSLGWPLATLAACLAATFLVVSYATQQRGRRDALRFEQRVERVRVDLVERVTQLRLLSTSLDDFWLMGPATDSSEWMRIVATLGATGNYPGLESAAVLVRSPAGPVVWGWRSLSKDSLPPPSGKRLAAWRRTADAVAKADLPMALDAAQDPEAAGASRAVVISPICRKAPDGKHFTVAAWSALTLNTASLLGSLMKPLPGEGSAGLRLDGFEAMPDGSERPVYSSAEGAAAGASARFEQVISMDSYGRKWRLRVSTTPAFDAQGETESPVGVLGACIAFSLLLTAMCYSLTNARTRAVGLAREMTASLERSSVEAKNLLTIADRSDTGLIILDRHLRLVWVNRIVCEQTGYSLEELKGCHFGFLLADPQGFKGVDTGKAVVTEADFRNRHGSKPRVELDIQPVSAAGGSPGYFLVTARLVDQTNEYRRGLRRAQKALEAVGDRIAIWDPEGKLIYLNPSFEAGFGYTLAECAALGGPFALVEDAALRETAMTWPETHGYHPVEVRMRCRNGSGHDMRVRMDRIVDGLGLTLGSVAVFVDISEHKQLEVELSEARDSALENARLKSAFLANMSHEIRTPLNGVTGMVNLLLTTRLDAEQREYAELANVSANSLLSVVNDILDFSKIEAGRMAVERVEFDPRELAADVVAVMSLSAKTKGLDLREEISPSVPQAIFGDPARLRQVLFNLLGNAIKFTPRGHVSLTMKATGETLRIEVSDTGIGIAPEARARLFQPFVQADRSTTRRFGGTGLGLAISRQIVELMGGSIGFSSEPGSGSIFWVEIPSGAGQAVEGPVEEAQPVS